MVRCHLILLSEWSLKSFKVESMLSNRKQPDILTQNARSADENLFCGCTGMSFIFCCLEPISECLASQNGSMASENLSWPVWGKMLENGPLTKKNILWVQAQRLLGHRGRWQFTVSRLHPLPACPSPYLLSREELMSCLWCLPLLQKALGFPELTGPGRFIMPPWIVGS